METSLGGQTDEPTEKVSEEMANERLEVDKAKLLDAVSKDRFAVLRKAVRDIQAKLDESQQSLEDTRYEIAEAKQMRALGLAMAARTTNLEMEIALLKARLAVADPIGVVEKPEDIVLLDYIGDRPLSRDEQKELLTRLHSTVLKLQCAYQVLGQSRAENEMLKGRNEEMTARLAPVGSKTEIAAQSVLLYMSDKNSSPQSSYGPCLNFHHKDRKWFLVNDFGDEVARCADIDELSKQIDKYKLANMEEPTFPNVEPIKTLYSDGSVEHRHPSA